MTRCPRCGATAAGDDYCLACRSPLHEPTRRTRYRDRLERNPLATALVVVVLAALGALVAIAASRGSSTTNETLVATNLPARTTVRAAPPVIGTLAAPPTTAPPATTTAPPATPPARPAATKLIRWSTPNGYTLVLASVPSDNGRATAVEIAKRALSQGLPEVGILNSQDFAGLHPGYFVVFSGVYASNADASSHLRQATAAGYAAAYARQVTR
jgi:hypothetical protein